MLTRWTDDAGNGSQSDTWNWKTPNDLLWYIQLIMLILVPLNHTSNPNYDNQALDGLDRILTPVLVPTEISDLADGI